MEILENEWLLMEILVRLPAEDLTRYKLVCKDWRDLIESPNFVSAHLNHSKRNPSRHHILFKGDTFHPFSSAIRFCSSNVIIVGSINGLICFAGKGTTKDIESPDDIWILNPITGNAIKLPFPDSPVDITGCDSVTFAFWCDSVTGAYKIVKITSIYDQNSQKLSIFSRPVVSNSVELWDSSYPDIWGKIPMNFDRCFHHASGWVTRCDAVIGMHCYWIMSYSEGLGAFILSFNMKTLVLEQISLPDISIPDKTLHKYLADDYKANFFGANWNGNFALVGKGKTRAGIHYYNVWKLEVCGVWNQKYCLHLDFGISRFINCIDATLVLERYGGGVVFYNTVNQKCFMLGKNGFYEMETPSDDMANVDHELYDMWLSLVAEGSSDSAEDYPYSFNEFRISWLGLDMQSSDDEIDNDLANTYAVSVDDFVGSLLTIDGFKPINHENLLFIRPSESVGNTNPNQNDEQVEAEQGEEEQDCSYRKDYWSIALKWGTSILDNLLHWEESKLLPSFPETGFRLDTALSGFGILCMPASKLAYKGVGDIRLGEAFYLWKGLEWNLTRQDLQCVSFSFFLFCKFSK
ncbi:hypothetical protein CASFOL_031615 [Castilleja foliolosa]|uniref:F-box domain-containing protein n=1 Tax=Castilleja foliolosa TaxID=1961234 RepID=A0ABD3C860_9LAMI